MNVSSDVATFGPLRIASVHSRLPLAELPASPMIAVPWHLRRIASDCIELPKVPLPSLTHVRVPGLDCTIALPSYGGDAVQTFRDYVGALQRKGIFASGDPAFAEDEQRIATLLQTTTATQAPQPRLSGRPVVGIVVSSPLMLLDRDHSRLESHAYLKDAIARIRAEGGEPVIIPPCADIHAPNPGTVTRIAACRALAQPLRGMVGMGGDDIDASMHGASNELCINTNHARDEFEACFARIALSRPLFALGVCRSHQLWNVIFGGTMFTDVQRQGASSVPQSQRGIELPLSEPYVLRDAKGNVLFANWVELAVGSQLSHLVRPFAAGCSAAMQPWAGAGLLAILTNSNHHQAVARIGAGFKLAGWSPDAKAGVSLIESTERWNALTSQWHPEYMKDPMQRGILRTVVNRAAIFDRLHDLVARGSGDVATIYSWAKARNRFSDADLLWIKTDLARNFEHVRRVIEADLGH